MKLTTAAQMKELDRQAIEERGIPSIDLMERAAAGRGGGGAGAAAPASRGNAGAAALCGAGNNGGDGIAAARLLLLKGARRCGRSWRGTTRS